MLDTLRDKLLPHHCHLCQIPTTRLLCQDCLALLKENTLSCQRCDLPLQQVGICPDCQQRPPIFDRALCGLEFDEHASFLINQMKHERGTGWLDVLLKPLLTKIDVFYADSKTLPQALIPVPLHWRRFLIRGFNQSDILARQLSKKYHIPVLTSVRKKHATALQQSLNRKQRSQNLAKVFALNTHPIPDYVAIVDDVVTTGATVDALANLLKTAGVERVDIWALARTPK